MAAAVTLISIDEYLKTPYHPDCEFVDGQLEERNVGEYEHSRLQSLLTIWFGNRESEWHVRVVTELRTRVSDMRVRVPDVCLIRASAPRERVTLTPPLLCVEILSPEDRLPRAAKVMEDYARMGVENLWILDPIERVAYVYKSDGELRLTSDRLSIPGTPIYVDLPALFANLD
ncbi:Endonuclease, Uma2 family (restriction endonuclease fold) [Granulicella rosea]|uniref:Endonuclease, Uma2 family (Restriction endonuclease fold) n=1 Tax=Granulicella rosea TaxID=474952 RepID=A0A239IZZ5_9BACT|nr:Uma2 family endonuclease [Granulicella rosea]SNS98788.1 Endonuclease, Uma2 family (restriction endonuclease fold) [Granulicella rosea]